MPTIVVGFDGTNWRLMDEWIEAGELPTIKYL